MSISTLTLALSVFQQNDLRVMEIVKSHPKNYHFYYKTGGKNRVMLVPKECDNPMKLQSEVGVLLSRNFEEQAKCGVLDGGK